MKEKSYLSPYTKVTLNRDKDPRNLRFLPKSLANRKIEKFKVIEAFVMFIIITFST